MSHSFLDPVIFHNASWHKQYLPLLQTALNQVIIRNFHLTIVQWKINMLLNLGLAIFGGVGLLRVGSLLWEDLLLLGVPTIGI